MEKVLIAGAVAVGIILLLVAGLAGYFYFVVFGNKNQILVRNLAVTSEWTEVKIDPPVKPAYDHQSIYLRPVNYVNDRESRSRDILLQDGTVVKPELEIYDESGNAIAFRRKGFALGHDGADFADFAPLNKLPTTRTYNRLRIRSDVPFECEQIKWIDYSPP